MEIILDKEILKAMKEADVRTIPVWFLFPEKQEYYRRCAKSKSPVLIQGETGTGKESFAKFLHFLSKRKGKFTPVNCGAIPENLIESELFGHKKGAFTDAVSDKKGLIEEADKGAILLDEIGELPKIAQVKLLRFLQEGEIRRVGDTKSIRVDVKVITATNRELKKEVAEGKFRADLFYRINTCEIYLPPLRAYKDNLKTILFENLYYLKMEGFTRPEGKDREDVLRKVFSPEALNALLKYNYPGNFRELNSILTSALFRSGNKRIELKHLKSEVVNLNPVISDNLFNLPYYKFIEKLDNLHKQKLETILKATNGNISKAAKQAGVERHIIDRAVKKFGLSTK